MIMPLRRRRSLSILPFALLLTAAGCQDPCAGRSLRTLIFVDQSASSAADAETRKIYNDTIAAVVRNALTCNGDRVHGFVVHANTLGKMGRQDVVYDLVRPDLDAMPKIQRLKAQAKFTRDSLAFVETAQARLSGLLDAQVAPRFRQHTDMLGTLEVISDELAGAGGNDTIRVYYLGDMRESMPGDRRNFDARLPRTVAEAEQWADADTAVLNQMQIHRDRFKNAHVRVLLGNLAAKPGGPEVRRYWQRMFTNAGFHAESVHF